MFYSNEYKNGFKAVVIIVHLLLVVLYIGFSYAVKNFGNYEYGMCPGESSKYMEYVKLSIRECVKKCATRPTCSFICYNRMLKTCSLHMHTQSLRTTLSLPGHLQVSIDTVNVPQLSGECNCIDGQTCEVDTGTCEIKECASLVEQYTELGNMVSVNSVKQLRCLGSQHTPSTTICQSNGEWSSVIQELDCYPGIANIAKNKPAAQISHLTHDGFTYTADLAVDGNTDTDLLRGKSCFHTQSSFRPWWRVDLLKLYCLRSSTVFNRMDYNWSKYVLCLFLHVFIVH